MTFSCRFVWVYLPCANALAYFTEGVLLKKNFMTFVVDLDGGTCDKQTLYLISLKGGLCEKDFMRFCRRLGQGYLPWANALTYFTEGWIPEKGFYDILL
jgi:hypothetical protein